jgi:hypothetical protein
MVDSNKIKIKYINTECSASYLFDNISVNDKNIMYIHNSELLPRIIVVDKRYIKFNKGC